MERFGRFIITAGLLAISGCLVTGCLWGNPGGEVRRGLSQEKDYLWSEAGQFSAKGKGPQTENFLMMEGLIVMTADPDTGEQVVDWDQSRITHYLKANPSGEAASNALTQAFKASTAQAEMFGKSFEAITGMLMPLLQAKIPAPPEPGAEPDEDGGITRDDALEIIRELRGDRGPGDGG